MKRLAATISILCLLVILTGHHFVFMLQRLELKDEMKRKILSSKDLKNIIEFRFSETQMQALEWEDDHEFFHNGVMYDVLSQNISGSEIVLRCISDKKENELLEAYQHQTEKKQDRERMGLIKLITSHFNITVLDLPQIIQTSITVQFPELYQHIISQPKLIQTPPPKAC